MHIKISLKAEASDGKGRTFQRVYRGTNPFKEHGVHLEKGSPFGLRRDNSGPVLEAGGRDIAISPVTYDGLMRSSTTNKE